SSNCCRSAILILQCFSLFVGTQRAAPPLFATASPGFQCDQACLSAPDNAKLQPRNPRFEITKPFSDSILSRSFALNLQLVICNLQMKIRSLRFSNYQLQISQLQIAEALRLF